MNRRKLLKSRYIGVLRHSMVPLSDNSVTSTGVSEWSDICLILCKWIAEEKRKKASD